MSRRGPLPAHREPGGPRDLPAGISFPPTRVYGLGFRVEGFGFRVSS